MTTFAGRDDAAGTSGNSIMIGSGYRAALVGALLAVMSAPASAGTLVPVSPDVIGVVTDAVGVPLPNARVLLAALNRVTTTDGNGVFTLRSLPAGTHHLTISYIGYAPGHLDVVVPSEGVAPVRVTIALKTTALQITTVTVTSSPVGSDARSTTAAETDLSGRALARSLGSSVAQTLSQEPGVAMRFSGPAAAAPVVRGLQGERILVLQDGDRAGDLSSAAPDHGITVDPLIAERVEVVRGPASLLYGNNALGGVVNVISNDMLSAIPTHVEGYVAGQTESVAPGAALAAGVTAPVGTGLAFIGRIGGRRSTDYHQGGGDALPNTYSHNWYSVTGLGYAAGPATGALVYRHYDFNYGLPSADLENSHIAGHRDQIAGRTEFAFGSSWLPSLRVGGTAQWYTHSEIASSGAVNTSFDLRTQTLDALGRTQFGAVKGAIGASGLFKQYQSTGDEALTPAATTRSGGVFVYEDIPLTATGNPDAQVPRLQIGARGDVLAIESATSADPKFGVGMQRSFSTFSGSVGVSLPLMHDVTLAVSTARAFRAPSVEELFSNAYHAAAGTYDRGNGNLRAEVNQGVDVMLRLQQSKVNGQIGIYASRISNYIAPNILKDTAIVVDGSPATVPLNVFAQGDADLYGFEGRVEGEVAPMWVIGAMGDLTRGAFVNGEPLPYMPPARIGVLARWDNRTWSFGGDVRHALAQTRVPPSAAADDPSALATDAYTVLNLSASYQVVAGDRLTTVTLRMDNALDERYRDATSRIKTFALNPGRNVSLVYKLNF
jgi:iron complex outermembrane receptor protein